MPANSPQGRRRTAVAGLLQTGKLDALLVTSLHNIRYLTGFTGSNAALLLDSGGDAIFFTDPRYTVQSSQQVDCRIRVVKGRLMGAVMDNIRRTGFRLVGFERDHLTVAGFEAINKDLPPKSSLVATSGLVEGLRTIKDVGEIASIRDSVTLNSKALAAALKRLKVGLTESEFAAEIDYQSRKLGAERPAFDTIVAAGARAALPHAQPGSTRIEAGMLLIDMGAFRHGYASDMTRMVYLGKVPRKYRTVYRAVLEAQEVALDVVRPGVTTSAVDRAARRVLGAYGLDREFIHSTGHGLGLEIHEPPRIGRKDKTPLAAGMAITIEPGVYIEGWGGIRIEDTVLVTPNGCEILTPTSKSLIEL